ncbi:C40 family peptidase [Pedobacter sp. P351]|uniref:C40 family peptidase n=1 Tax=Pedobacter superstes TaxID=3133441 RepID=UPI0030B1311C
MLTLFIASCRNSDSRYESDEQFKDTADHTEVAIDTNEITEPLPPSSVIDTRDIDPEDLTAFAKTLIGTPYKYGSVEPQKGFDCSGFITYVFNHFQIAVPRSSVDFTNVGTEIRISESKPGDLILFTGTDSTIREVGHMGIIVENADTTKFIHSTSGKAYGVTITPVNKYYQGRFVKTIRIFN